MHAKVYRAGRGWAKPLGSERWHFFVNSRSLCRNWHYMWEVDDRLLSWEVIGCKTCRKELKKAMAVCSFCGGTKNVVNDLCETCFLDKARTQGFVQVNAKARTIGKQTVTHCFIGAPTLPALGRVSSDPNSLARFAEKVKSEVEWECHRCHHKPKSNACKPCFVHKIRQILDREL